MTTLNRIPASPVKQAMNRRTATIIAVALLVFATSAAVVAAQTPHGKPGAAPTPAGSPAATPAPPAPTPTNGLSGGLGTETPHTYGIFPGPEPVDLVRRVAAWWMSAGANVRLIVVNRAADANVVITPERPMPGEQVGEASAPCVLPCRPDGKEVITLSTRRDYSKPLTLAHEIGHTIGMPHLKPGSLPGFPACTVMEAFGDHCGGQLPPTVPEIDRRELLKIWGPAPAPNPFHG